MQTLLNKR